MKTTLENLRRFRKSQIHRMTAKEAAEQRAQCNAAVGKSTKPQQSVPMHFTISPDRRTLTLSVNAEEREALRELGEEIHQDATMAGFLEPITCNSELEWIHPHETGDLTEAPMLGILGDTGPRSGFQGVPHHGLRCVGCWGEPVPVPRFQPILERWAWADYAVRSLLEELRDRGQAVLVS